MNVLDEILNRISKNDRSLTILQDELKGVVLGNQVYIIEESFYDVNFLFDKFLLINNSWITDISINQSNKVKEIIFDNELKELMNKRIYEILISINDLSSILKSINS